jgi:small acid-soluble spore protein I (minor)
MGDKMNIDIRSYIKKNFEGTSVDEIKQSIDMAIQKKDDITLPGLGFFFEIIWNNSNDKEKGHLLTMLFDYLK